MTAAIQTALSNLNIQDGNSKLEKTAKILAKMLGKKVRIFAFNLPAGFSGGGKKVCIGAGDCLKVCYAQQGTFNFKGSKRVREANLSALNEIYKELGEQGVVDALIPLVKKSKATHVRIHDSGDFFALWYLRAWVRVAEALPEVVLYAYTKSVPFFSKLILPENFKITFSYGGIWDDKIPEGAPVSRIFTTHEDRIAAGYEDGNSEEYADALAILGTKKIGLVYHGTRNLTEEQKIIFSKAA